MANRKMTPPKSHQMESVYDFTQEVPRYIQYQSFGTIQVSPSLHLTLCRTSRFEEMRVKMTFFSIFMKCLRMTPDAFLECSSDFPSKHWCLMLHFGLSLVNYFFCILMNFMKMKFCEMSKYYHKMHFRAFYNVFGSISNILQPSASSGADF